MVAKAALYPQVSTSGTVDLSNSDLFRQQVNSNSGFNGNWFVTLSASQTFFNGGVTRNQIGNAKLGKEVSANQLQQAINQANL